MLSDELARRAMPYTAAPLSRTGILTVTKLRRSQRPVLRNRGDSTKTPSTTFTSKGYYDIFFGNGYSKTLCCHGKTGSGYLSLGHIPWQPIQIVNSLLMMLIGFNLPTVMMRNTVIKPLKFK